MGIFSSLFGEKGKRAELAAILHELAQPLQLANMLARIELCQKALALVRREQDPEIWAALHGELGHCCAQNPHGERAGNLERAIQHFEQALAVYTRETFPQD